TSGRAWSWLIAAGYTAAAVLVIANFRGALVHRLTPHAWGWYIEPAPLYALMTASVLAYLPLSIARIAYTYRRPASARQQVQAQFWLLAIGASSPFVVTNLLPLYGINVYPLGSFGNAAYLGIIAYAIARHRLMDVDYVVRKAVSFSLAASAVLIPGGMALFALCREVGSDGPAIVACAAVGLALLSVVLIPTFQEALETRVHDPLNGFIGLGQKKDYRIFSGEDLRLLSAVASGATVALENASLSRQLRRSEAVLERANRLSSLGMLAAGLAHEIRNPLVAVKTFLDLLPQRLNDAQFLSEFRELSLSELRRVTDLI